MTNYDSPRPDISYIDDLPLDSEIHPQPEEPKNEPSPKSDSRRGSDKKGGKKKEKPKPPKQPKPKKERSTSDINIGEKITQIKEALTGTSARIIFGIFLGCLAVYLGVAFVSYFVNCVNDQSSINSYSIGNATDIANSAGEGGARLSEFLINESFGLGSIVIIFWIGAISLKMLIGHPRFKTVNFTIKCLVALITVSLIVGLSTIALHSPINWGGFHGRYVNEWIMHMVGNIGAVLVCVFMISLFVSICLSDLVQWILRLKRKRDEKKRLIAEQIAAEQARAEEWRRRLEEEKIADIQAGETVDLTAEREVVISEDSVSFGEDALYNIEVKPTEENSDYRSVYKINEEPDVDSSDTNQNNSLHLKTASDVSTVGVTTAAPVNYTQSPTYSPVSTPDETNVTAEAPAVSPAPMAAPAVSPAPMAAPAVSPAPMAAPAVSSEPMAAAGVASVPVNTTTGGQTQIEPTVSEETAEEDVMVVNVNSIDQVSKPHYRVGDSPADHRPYKFPPFEILRPGIDKIPVDIEEQRLNKEKIEATLLDFGIPITRIEATVGPTVTLYEIVPDKGVKIAKIRSLADDIALRISANGGVRIIAPIPGKGTVGLEVANRDAQIVSMRTVIQSRKFQETKSILPVAMGSTISNDVYIADLSKMPHLLVAGATGQGKSVGLNAIIASLLYSKKPSDLKFVMIDPKQVEFSLYNKIKDHYMAAIPSEMDEEPVITDMKKVEATLNSLCVEMDNRYNLLKNAHTRNIEEYNTKYKEGRLNPKEGHRYLPYIVVVVDEFGDLIMVSGKNVEMPIARLAQKARAVGMHVIIATQRPSTNVITGIIKANFPARISFKVSSGVDSKTILDTTGAQQLIGRGDMLIFNNSEMVRVQCAFLDTPEVEEICDYIEKQPYPQGVYPLPEPQIEDNESPTGAGGAIGERDSLFEDAARLIVNSGVASASMLQRKMSVGYARAGKLIDQLEAAGIIGASQGGKPRPVLTDPNGLETILNSL